MRDRSSRSPREITDDPLDGLVQAAGYVKPLTPTLAIRIPTVPGYAAAKLAAWLDRSALGQTKDANDLALVSYWYAELKEVEDRLYDTSEGQQILVAEEVDVPRAATRLLGTDVAAVVGPERISELVERWPGDLDMLVRNFTMSTGPRRPEQENRRHEVIDALTRGLASTEVRRPAV